MVVYCRMYFECLGVGVSGVSKRGSILGSFLTLFGGFWTDLGSVLGLYFDVFST